MGGSVDYTTDPHFIQTLIVHAASFWNFFACNFSKHYVNQQVAMLHGVDTLLVRNNVNYSITAGNLRDLKGEED